MSNELELCIKVKGYDVGRTIAECWKDGEESGEGVALVSDSYTIEVTSVEREDGLPLNIDDEFTKWMATMPEALNVGLRELARKAFYAGREGSK